MKTKMTKEQRRNNLLALVESSMMIALAIVLDLLCKLIPSLWEMGGSISISCVPMIYLSYRRGWKWGIGAGFVYSCVEMITGFYVPPANTFAAIVLCVLLDYVLAFAALGTADIFAKPFVKGGKPVVGYIVGAIGVSVLRFLCSFLSGGILWDSYAPEGMGAWVYSLVYNGSYMLLNAVLASIIIAFLCAAIDPRTLKPMRK